MAASPQTPSTPEARVIRFPETMQRCGKKRTSLLQAIKDGDFPPPIKIGPRAIGFIESEVDQWIAARMKERDANLVRSDD